MVDNVAIVLAIYNICGVKFWKKRDGVGWKIGYGESSRVLLEIQRVTNGGVNGRQHLGAGCKSK